MIAVETSSLVEYLSGGDAPDVALVDRALDEQRLVLPPVVLTEVLSGAGRAEAVTASLLALPLLEPPPGHRERAGLLRARLRSRGFTARLADVAQGLRLRP